MSVDGQDGEQVNVTTGPSISPVLFAICIAEIYGAVERQMEGSRGIPSVDGVTWLVEGTDLNGVISKLERCAAASLQWADNNAVCFEMPKTEKILFSKKGSHRRCSRDIQVGSQTGGHTLVRDLAGFHVLPRREPPPADRNNPPGRGQAFPNRQQVRRPPPGGSAQPPDGHRPGHHALCG